MVNTMETTYVTIKPDGVQRGLISEIIGRFERKGLKLVGLKAMVPSEEIARLTTMCTKSARFSRPHQIRDLGSRGLHGVGGR